MEYLIKASAIIFIFYVSYKIFLQRETFFQANRWYLLFGIIISALIPFILIPNYIEYTAIITENFVPVNNSIEISQVANEKTIDIWSILFPIYSIGVIFFLGKLCIEFASLKILFNKHKYYKNASFSLIETDNDILPFSFFNWIVYNPKKYSQNELNHILNHEKVHAKELHSIDVVLTQLACVLLWFNPFIWLYKKEVQQNLEFIADKKAQNFSECKKSYQLILLKSSIPNHKFLIANHFYNSQIKKRIIMLHKSKSNKLNSWKYGLILPVLALFLMSFNTKDIFVEIEDPIADTENLIQSKTSAHLNTFYEEIAFDDYSKSKKVKTTPSVSSSKTKNKIIAQVSSKSQKLNPKDAISIKVITKNTTDNELNEIKADLKKEGLTVKFKGVRRNKKGEMIAIKIDAKSDKSNANYNTNSDEAISPIKIVFDEENDSISIGNTHSGHGSHNTFVYSTDHSNHKIHHSANGSNVFVISDDGHEHEQEHEHDNDSECIVKHKGKKGKVHVVSEDHQDGLIEVIVEDINNVRADIEGRNTWVKDKRGNEEDVIIIEGANSKNNIVISGDIGESPLYIIDDDEVSKNDFKKLGPDDIESITVLKGKSAKKEYGEDGENGVIIVKTKKN